MRIVEERGGRMSNEAFEELLKKELGSLNPHFLRRSLIQDELLDDEAESNVIVSNKLPQLDGSV